MNDERKDATEKPAPLQANTSLRTIAKELFANWALWSPALGGMVLLTHFWQIGYTPSLSFTDLGTVLGAMLLFAVVGLLAFSGLMLLPIFILSQWVDSGVMRGPPIPVPEHRRLSDRERKAQDRRTLRGKRARDRDHPAIRNDFSAGSAISFMTSGVVSFACYVLVWTVMYQVDISFIDDAVLIIFAFFGLIEVILTLAGNAPFLRRRLRYLRRHPAQWWLLFVLYMGMWPMVLLPFISMGTDYLESRSWFFALALLAIPFLHWMWFVTMRVKKAELWPPKVGLIILILLTSGMPKAAVDAAMNTFGLGMIPRVDVVLTARGCDIAHAAWPQRACVPQRRDDLDAYRLENVEVLTRIGAHYYVGAPGAMRNDALVRFPIPSDEVLSWRRRPDVPKPATPTKPAKISKP